MRHPWVFLARSLLIGSVAACSSSSAGVPVVEAGAAPDASPDATVGAVNDAGAGEDASNVAPDASQPIADAEPDSGLSHAEVDASMACVSFCKCMAMNCADKVFPDGCLYDCATQTDWDLPCRANMCSLVPAQPNNDHCTHAFGVNECLDQ
jgi:hypothetical protein